MTISKPRSGYTLPVFACAASVAALHWLRHQKTIQSVLIDLIDPAAMVEIAIEQTSGLKEGMALAIAKSDPGDNLDLTSNTPVWALVEWRRRAGEAGEAGEAGGAGGAIVIKGGEGIGRHSEGGQAAIYAYAQKLLQTNLQRLLEPGESAPGQLDAYREQLQSKASSFDSLVFCVGENGLDLAGKLGINPERLIKTANWIGPLLVEAGLQGVKEILLFGYHGKLMKLAGGIFHTHHHLADARLEILTAHCANLGLPTSVLQAIFASPTAEAALKYLRDLDATTGSEWVIQVYGAIAVAIDQRSQDYIFNHSECRVTVGSILFDRDRSFIVKSNAAFILLGHLC
jgi:cobalt-precorrin-5B (C1)-methyltransferase